MSGIDSSILSVALQIPIVAAFIWFALQIDSRNREYLKKQNQEWREFLKEDGLRAREFFREMQKLTLDNVKEVSEDLKILSKNIGEMNGLLVAHDLRSQEYIRDLREQQGLPPSGKRNG